MNFLNESLEVLIKRLIIARNIKMTIVDEKGKINNFIRNQFFIPNQLLDNYIINITPLKIDSKLLNATSLIYDEADDLEEFKISNLIYSFDGIIISRLKF